MSQIHKQHGAVSNNFPQVYNRPLTLSCLLIKNLISDFNAHCHLTAGMAFIEFRVSCGWVSLSLSLFPYLFLPNREFGELFSRIPKLVQSSYLQTNV